MKIILCAFIVKYDLIIIINFLRKRPVFIFWENSKMHFIWAVNVSSNLVATFIFYSAFFEIRDKFIRIIVKQLNFLPIKYNLSKAWLKIFLVNSFFFTYFVLEIQKLYINFIVLIWILSYFLNSLLIDSRKVFVILFNLIN